MALAIICLTPRHGYNIHRRRPDNTLSRSCLHEGQNSPEARARGKKLRVPLEKMKRNVLWLSVLLFALLYLSLTLSKGQRSAASRRRQHPVTRQHASNLNDDDEGEAEEDCDGSVGVARSVLTRLLRGIH
ncbi:hypothetical protein PUN28_010980 [Cardiocondyla obscurior]|uniref:Transmembrane protein n=1 Tax=Cardiocondyla obscurior TaxID=286306 RepID=A0AAW2FK45_9HYME